jgi:hypothetical protein
VAYILKETQYGKSLAFKGSGGAEASDGIEKLWSRRFSSTEIWKSKSFGTF